MLFSELTNSWIGKQIWPTQHKPDLVLVPPFSARFPRLHSRTKTETRFTPSKLNLQKGSYTSGPGEESALGQSSAFHPIAAPAAEREETQPYAYSSTGFIRSGVHAGSDRQTVDLHRQSTGKAVRQTSIDRSALHGPCSRTHSSSIPAG